MYNFQVFSWPIRIQQKIYLIAIETEHQGHYQGDINVSCDLSCI